MASIYPAPMALSQAASSWRIAAAAPGRGIGLRRGAGSYGAVRPAQLIINAMRRNACFFAIVSFPIPAELRRRSSGRPGLPGVRP